MQRAAKNPQGRLSKSEARAWRRLRRQMRLARLEWGISLRMLAQATDYPVRYFSAVERGTHFPSIEFHNRWTRSLLLLIADKIEAPIQPANWDRRNPAIVPMPSV